MEVEEEAQAVLLEEMEGTTQYIIQRGDGETLSKVFALTGDIISEGMVVDMINANVENEFSTGTQFYTSQHLLSHDDMTEEDRRLADALVAVHQQHQLHQQSQQQSTSLGNVSHLGNLGSINAYSIETIDAQEPAPPAVFESMQAYKVENEVKEEFISVKNDYAVEADNSAESNDGGPKRSLPHKKRKTWELRKNSRKVKQVKKSVVKVKDSRYALETTPPASNLCSFVCQLCNEKLDNQLDFFQHLKVHYEPFKKEPSTLNKQAVNVPLTIQNLSATEMNEFSDPEDLLEGIRGVVEETEAHIDEETRTSVPDTPMKSAIEQACNTKIELKSPPKVPQVKNVAKTEEKDTEENSDTGKKKKPRKNKSEALTCRQCDRTFHHKNSLIYHMRSHSGERPHQCEICGKSFFAASALKVHKRLHSGDKPYKCEDCGRNFRQWGDLKYHSTSLHSEQKQFQCEYCGKDFARKYSLIVHRRIHTGEKNYLCEFCNKTFRASSYLQNHRRIHTGEKPHPCDICGKPFRVRSDMKRHMHTHSRSGRPANHRPSIIAASVKSRELVDDDEDDEDDENDDDDDDDHSPANNARTIQDLVRELKLEVQGGGGGGGGGGREQGEDVETTPQSPESILPHGGSSQVLEYNPVNSSSNESSGNTKDPLESVVRDGETIPPYFFM